MGFVKNFIRFPTRENIGAKIKVSPFLWLARCSCSQRCCILSAAEAGEGGREVGVSMRITHAHCAVITGQHDG